MGPGPERNIGADERLIAVTVGVRMSVSRGGKAPRVLVVGRLLDTFHKDAGGVSALQHFCKVRNPAAGAAERSEKVVISC